MKLIDVDALCTNPGNVRKVTEYDEAGYAVNYNAVPLKAILDAPAVLTIDLATTAPVVYAKWVLDDSHPGRTHKCSRCEYRVRWRTPYCGHCGARMRSKEAY